RRPAHAGRRLEDDAGPVLQPHDGPAHRAEDVTLSILPSLLLAGLLSAAAAATPAPVAGDCPGSGPQPPPPPPHRAGLPPRAPAPPDGVLASSCGPPERRGGSGPPAGVVTLPRPEVLWHEATFAEVRFEIGAGHVSYFFEAKRRRLSRPLPDVLAV